MENNSNSVREFEYLPKQKVKEFAFCKPLPFGEAITPTMVCSDNIDVAKNIPIENDHFILTTPQQLGPLWCTDFPDLESEELGGKLRFCVPERIKSQNVMSTIGKFEKFYGSRTTTNTNTNGTVMVPSTTT